MGHEPTATYALHSGHIGNALHERRAAISAGVQAGITYPYMTTDKRMSSQSFSTPATFMVKAEVLPMSRKTAMLRAANTQRQGMAQMM